MKTTNILLLVMIFAVTKLSAQESVQVKDTLKSEKKSPGVPWTVRPYSIQVGAFWAVNDMSAGAGLRNHPYSVVNFQDDLGMDQNAYSILAGFKARFNRRHRVDLTYYNVNQDATATLQKEIQFGEHTYPVDGSVKAALNANIFRVAYGYAFVTNEKIDFGAYIGFHAILFNMDMKLTGNQVNASFGDDASLFAPLPDLGLWATYAFHKKWAVTLETGYFHLAVPESSGTVVSANTLLQYNLARHWELDLGFTYLDLKAAVSRPILKGDIHWKYYGPSFRGIYKF